MGAEIDYHKEDIDFWNNKVSWQDVEEIVNSHKVEVLVQSDCQFHCFIDYKKGNGSDGIGLTFIGALKEAVHNFKNKGKKDE